MTADRVATIGGAPTGRLHRATQILREGGPRGLWFALLGELCYRRVRCYARDLQRAPFDVTASLPVEIAPLRPEEVDEYQASGATAGAHEIRRRLAAGQRCTVARADGRIVHACWTTAGRARVAYLSRELPLAPDEVYYYESFTAPAFRGRGIAAACNVRVQHMLREEGVRRILAVVVPERTAGARALERAGFRPDGVRRTVWIGPWRWHWKRPGAAPVGAAYWNEVARNASGRSHHLDPFLGELKRRVHLDLIARWGGVPVHGAILKTDLFEEAHGPDAFAWSLTRAGNQVVGVDISPAMVAAARRRDRDRRVRYVSADARNLPFRGGAFSLIVSPSTLDHFADPADLGRSLRELRRLLAPEGQLIVTLDNRENVFDPVLRLCGRLGLLPFYLGRSYTIAELHAELDALDLEVLDTTAILHNPRMVATAAIAAANRLGWPPLVRLVRRAVTAAQGLEHTPWRYRTGSFIAAHARRRRREPPAD